MAWPGGGEEDRIGSDLADPQIAAFAQRGILAVETGTARFRFPAAATLIGVSASVNTAPTGASVIVDVHKNGTTVYTTQANRPAIAASEFAAAETAPDVTSIAAGDYITVDVSQVGSTIPGSDLGVFVRYVWAT
jgi:hypothetical protein